MKEKCDMLETRFAVRRQAEQQKRAMLQTVEKMKKKGQFSKSDLAALGLNIDDSEAAMAGGRSVGSSPAHAIQRDGLNSASAEFAQE